MSKLILFWFGLKTFFCTCNTDHRLNDFKKVRAQYKISKIGKLSSSVNESSGILWNPARKALYSMNDSDGTPELFEMDSTGNLRLKIKVTNAVNRDWEDLAAGAGDTVYIGDFGNNANNRKDLTIYKTALPPSGRGETQATEIQFHYEDQRAFPPDAENLNFDCEAFFYFKGRLYLFSKNRSKKNHMVKLYGIEAREGNHTAVALDSVNIDTQVTSADISPDGKTFAVLTYGKILLFGIEEGIINFRQPKGCFRFSHLQTEAIALISNQDMIATNEQGSLFLITHR